jgi:hypothetical protein
MIFAAQETWVAREVGTDGLLFLVLASKQKVKFRISMDRMEILESGARGEQSKKAAKRELIALVPVVVI